MNGKKDNRIYIRANKNNEVEYIAKLIEARIKEKETIEQKEENHNENAKQEQDLD